MKMTKEVIEKIEAEVGLYIGNKAEKYAKKYGWSGEYLAKAVNWMKHGVADAVRAKEAMGEKIKDPIAFCKYAAVQSLKRDKTGKLVIPYWKMEVRTGSGVVVTYADKKEML